MLKKPLSDFLSKGPDYVCKMALRRKEKVFLWHNDENGELLWAIVLEDIPDFWLNAFLLKKEAVDYCKKHKLPITYIEKPSLSAKSN